MKVVLVSLLILLGIPAGFLAYLHFEANTKVHFATFDEARRVGAIGDDRRIPEALLPQSATDITLQVNTDTNDRWITYTFTGRQEVRLPECTVDPALDVNAIRAPWWWAREASQIAKKAEKYRCIDRGELIGFWLEDDCVLVQGSARGAFHCNTGRMKTKDGSVKIQ